MPGINRSLHRTALAALLIVLVLAVVPAAAEMPAAARMPAEQAAGPEILQGLTEEDDNFFVSPDPLYGPLAGRVEKTSHSNCFNGSILIATDDEIILYGGPRARTTDGNPVDPYTVYEIGSVSKTFTAVVVMRLAERGRLHLDDTLDLFFPEYGAGKKITIADLLYMQSGIIDYVNESEVFFAHTGKKTPEVVTDDSLLTDGEFLDCLFSLPLSFEPGTRYEYSNTNYHLLALIVEKSEGMSYGDVVRREIFDPCGMAHSSAMATGDETSVPDAETGYHRFQKGSRGAGDVHSCMADLLAFDRALFGGGLVSRDSMALMMDFRFGSYGCGLYPYGPNAYGHSGAVTSYVSHSVVIETEAFGRVYLIASTSSSSGLYGLESTVAAVQKELYGK